jgi:hypothetical protein
VSPANNFSILESDTRKGDADMQARIGRAVITVVAGTLLSVGLMPGPASADDSPRISQLELEIQRLRTRVDEQQRRILRVEEELSRRTGADFPATPPPKRVTDTAAGKLPTSGPLPWHSAKTWARVAKGMTEVQVKEILGPPASAEATGSYMTMFYRGPVAGAGTVSGIVNLRDGRVVAVNAPDF